MIPRHSGLPERSDFGGDVRKISDFASVKPHVRIYRLGVNWALVHQANLRLRILYVPSGVVRLEFEPVGGYCARMIPSGSSHIRRQVDVSRACRGSAASPNAPNSPPRKGKGWTETNRRRAAQQGATGRHRGPNAAAAPRFWFLSGHFFPRVAWSHKVTSYSELFRCAQQVRTPVSE